MTTSPRAYRWVTGCALAAIGGRKVDSTAHRSGPVEVPCGIWMHSNLCFAVTVRRRGRCSRILQLQPMPRQAVQGNGGLKGIPRHLNRLQHHLQPV
jgi:hypothetical protein